MKSVVSLRAHLGAALALSLCLAGSASALTIDVTGVAGSGTSVWTFSGTSSAGNLAASAKADGFFSLSGTNNFFGALNNWQGGFTPTNFGPLSFIDLALGTGATVTGSSSGVHVLEGFDFFDGGFERFAWWADGAFPGNETLTYSGSATAAFDIGLINGIAGLGDFTTVTATSKGGLTMNFTAVPEPSTVLLLGVGLLALGAARRRRAA